MNQNTLDKFKPIFNDFIKFEHEHSDGYSLLVPTTDDWEYDLPSTLDDANYMKLEITGWTHEESYLDTDGIYLKVAFGEDENSKFFNFDQILSLMDLDGKPILTNLNYKPIIDKSIIPEPETKHTMKSIMHKDTEGLKLSKSKLSLVTPKKKDKKPKDK